MKEYFCEVNIRFSGNNFEANSKEDYIKKVKQSFIDEFGIKIQDYEIKNIESEEK
jgi:hypothetical protein